MTCCIKGCNSDYQSKIEGLSLFNFPRRNDRRHKIWMNKIGEENIKQCPPASICSKHFEPDVINRTFSVAQLKEDAMPTIFPVILRAAELNNSSLTTIDDPRKALTMVIDTGVCKGVLPEQNTTKEASPDVYEVHVHVPREPGSINTSPHIKPSTTKPKGMAEKRQLSLTSTDVEAHKMPWKKAYLSKSSLRAAKIEHLTKVLRKHKLKIKALMQAKNRLEKKVITFKNVIDELKKHSKMSKEHEMLMEESQKYLTRQASKWGRQKKV